MDPQVAAQVRNSLITIGGAVVGSSLTKYGVDANAVMPSAVGLLMALGGAAWSWFGHRHSAVINAATKVPGVIAVVTTPAVAVAASPSKDPLENRPPSVDGKDAAPVITLSETPQLLEMLQRAGIQRA